MRLALVLALGACTFRPNPMAVARDGAVDGPSPMIDAVDARVIMTDAAAPFCDPTDTTLIACYEFENTTNDASGHDLNASSTGVSFVTGKLGMAAHADAGTQMNVGENALLDPPALTIEAWIRAPLPATGTRAGIVDNQGQWGFFLQPGGDLQGLGLTSTAAVPDSVWTHVAETYDGTTRHYVNGVQVGATAGGGGALGTAGVDGISIAADNPPGAGSPLNGDIDQLRIYAVARTAEQIAADATP